MNVFDIERDIRNFIVGNFLFGEDNGELSNEDSLLNEGIIDSTGILELIVFLEEKYDFKIEDEELTAENLDSIKNVAGFVIRKKVA